MNAIHFNDAITSKSVAGLANTAINEPLQAVIIEDEVPAARLLASMLHRLRPEWVVTVLPGTIEDSVQWFATHTHPNLLFLDIQLSDGNSFDFLIQAQPISVIIFTTAYDQYAIRAFNVNSIDYILKPIDESRLLEAIVKYETLTGNTSPARPVDYLESLIESLQSSGKRYRTRFLIAGADRYKPLPIEDIAYFYSENRVTFAVTHTAQEHVIDLSLNKLNEQLDPDRFFRANRQMIVSIEAIDHIEPYFNGKISITLKPRHKMLATISEEKVSAFKLWLNY